MTTSANQLNLVNQVQTPMYSFMLLNIANIITHKKAEISAMADYCEPDLMLITETKLDICLTNFRPPS